LMLYSAANGSMSPWAWKQILRFSIGFAIMLAVALVDSRSWMAYAYPFYGISLLLLLGVEVMGFVGKGAIRWIDLYIVQLQPTELMKIALILALAYVAAQNCTGMACAQCSNNGCSFCVAYSSQAQAGCHPPSATAASTNCNGVGDQADKFIAPGNPTVCFGGCSTAEDCNTCAGYIGCGWCHATGGCFPQVSGGAPASCKSWTQGTCEIPCDQRTSCTGCAATGTYVCSWSTTTSVCATGTTGITDHTKCPDYVPPGNNAAGLAVAVPLLAASLAIAF